PKADRNVGAPLPECGHSCPQGPKPTTQPTRMSALRLTEGRCLRKRGHSFPQAPRSTNHPADRNVGAPSYGVSRLTGARTFLSALRARGAGAGGLFNNWPRKYRSSTLHFHLAFALVNAHSSGVRTNPAFTGFHSM